MHLSRLGVGHKTSFNSLLLLQFFSDSHKAWHIVHDLCANMQKNLWNRFSKFWF